MIKYDDVTTENMKDHKPYWMQNINELDTEYRILIIGVLDLEKQKRF